MKCPKCGSESIISIDWEICDYRCYWENGDIDFTKDSETIYSGTYPFVKAKCDDCGHSDDAYHFRDVDDGCFSPLVALLDQCLDDLPKDKPEYGALRGSLRQTLRLWKQHEESFKNEKV